MSKIHIIKIWPEYFEAIVSGRKKFELRKNDRDYRVGDVLVVQEFDPKKERYTGEMQTLSVTYIAQGVFGLPEDTCILSVTRFPQDGPLPSSFSADSKPEDQQVLRMRWYVEDPRGAYTEIKEGAD